jgi:hypothetical protein
VINALRYDWVHNSLQDGTLTVEATELIREARVFGVTMRTLEEYTSCDRWCFPAASHTKSRQLHRVFSTWRNPKDEDIKIRASGSELLGLYGLLRHFVETRTVHSSGVDQSQHVV